MTTRIRQLDGVGARKDYYHVDPRAIRVENGWNPRTDFAGLDDLKNSIIENGVLVPLRVKRGPDDEIILIDGERRLRATLTAIEEGRDIQSVPCIFERNGIGEIEAFFLSLLANQGEPLNPVEEAEAFRRLKGWGLSIAGIAKRIGKSPEFVRGRLALVDASPEVQNAVKTEQVGIKDAIKIVKNAGGNIKAQNKALAGTRTKANPNQGAATRK